MASDCCLFLLARRQHSRQPREQITQAMTRAAPATLPTTTPTGNWRAREIILERSTGLEQLTDANVGVAVAVGWFSLDIAALLLISTYTARSITISPD